MTVCRGAEGRLNHDLDGVGPTGDPAFVRVVGWLLLLGALPGLLLWVTAAWLVDRWRR